MLDILKIKALIARSTVLALDTETDSVKPREAKMVGFSISDGHESYYVPVAHTSDNVSESVWRELLVEIHDKELYGHNAPFDMWVLRRATGIDWKFADDTMLMAYSTGEFFEFGLKALVKQIFGHRMTELTDLFPSHKEINFARLPADVAESYAADDALFTFKLRQFLYEKLTPKTRKIYALEMRVMPFAMRMEELGLPCDRLAMESEGKRLDSMLPRIVEIWFNVVAARLKISYEEAMMRYPINSTPYLVKLLYLPPPDGLGLDVLKRTPTGTPSTDEDALRIYRSTEPIVNCILTYREVQARANRYFLKFAKMIDSSGRLHPDVNQMGATTGRWATSNPNVQNMPHQDEWTLSVPGGETATIVTSFRSAIKAPPGFSMLSLDYNQIEYRLMAGHTQSQYLLDMYKRGEDVHIATASVCFGVPKHLVTKSQRKDGKTINFALVYGMGLNHFYRHLGGRFSMPQASDIYRRYFEPIPELIEAQDKMRRTTKSTHSVETYFGRFQRIPEYYTGNPKDLAKAERAGLPRRIQGTAADVLKLAIVMAGEIIDQQFPSIEMILTIHDQIIFLVPDNVDMLEFCHILRPRIELQLPGYPMLKVDFSKGTSYDDLEGFEIGDVSIETPTRRENLCLYLPKTVTAAALKYLSEILGGTGGNSLTIILDGSFRTRTTAADATSIRRWAESVRGAEVKETDQ